jgi:predicted acetyltransferase
MQLVLPSAEYKDSYIAAVKEFQADTDNSLYSRGYKSKNVAELEADFATFVQKEIAQSRGEGLSEGWVPHTKYWLVDEGEFIGSVDIRHHLTERLEKTGGHIGYGIRPSQRKMGYGTLVLQLALPKAKELGIDRVLITCDSRNEGSKKVIENNGGVFQDSIDHIETDGKLLRFWIENT